MKPWLLNILACPIDKHHPLDAYFFRWVLQPAPRGAVSGEHLRVLEKQIKEGVISPPSIAAIHDASGVAEYEAQRKLALSLLERGVRGEGLEPASRYLNGLDVAEGLLVCPQCGRWYPIGCSVESVPELMPDELREKAKDLEWIGKWMSLVPEAVKLSGQPYRP